MNIVITAGGTSEHIDAVRTITNTGTGMLAAIIVDTILKSSINVDKIFYIHTTKAFKPQTESDKISFIQVEDTNSVAEAVKKVLTENTIDWFIHAMAISDYYVDFVSTADRVADSIMKSLTDLSVERPADIFLKGENRLDNSKKLSSNEDNLVVVLRKTPKIINSIKKLSPNTNLIGFKLLNNVTVDDLRNAAYNQMETNDCSYVVANDSAQINSTKHEAYIFGSNNSVTHVHTNGEIASALTNIMIGGN